MAFIRIAGCNLRCPYCDTDFYRGEVKSLKEIATILHSFPTDNILWTGGEPTLLLTDSIVAYFRRLGYRQSIETNGTLPPPKGLDYISCSPKPEAFGRLWRNFPEGVSEWRFPFGENIPLPPAISALPPATNYFVSPIFQPNATISEQKVALESCIAFVLAHPQWQLSIQTHKLAGFR